MGTVEEQAARHAEACRRANPAREIPEGEPGHDIINRPAGFGVGPNTMSSGDTWSSGGAMPGVETPDLQGPTKPLTYPDNAGGGFAEGNHNTEDIIRGGRR